VNWANEDIHKKHVVGRTRAGAHIDPAPKRRQLARKTESAAMARMHIKNEGTVINGNLEKRADNRGEVDDDSQNV